MAAFDQYLKSVPKIPFVNVSNRTIPAYGAMTLWTLDKHGWFQALPGAVTHIVGNIGFNNKHNSDVLFSGTHHVAGATGEDGLDGPIGPIVDAPHTTRSDDDPRRGTGETNRGVYKGKMVFEDMAIEWATAFNLGSAVDPKNRGYCYQQLPAVGILQEPDYPIRWGYALTVRLNSFTLIPSSQPIPGFEDDGANGWPFMGRVPNTKDLVIIGGLNSFVEENDEDEDPYV
jgi:hypothetical protein